MRYKIVARIVLILSFFNFVLAAPVTVHEVRESSTDAMSGDEDTIIVSGKRAREDEIPNELEYWPSGPELDQSLEVSQHLESSRSNINYRSVREYEPPPPRDETKPDQLGTSIEIQSASSSQTEKGPVTDFQGLYPLSLPPGREEWMSDVSGMSVDLGG